jgi:hypothetical protein
LTLLFRVPSLPILRWSLSGSTALHRGILRDRDRGEPAGTLRGREAACELRTLSDALRRESIDRVDLIKIDVEKTELDVLAGIEDADWPRIRQLMMELHLDSERRERAASTIRRAASTSRCARIRQWRELTPTCSKRSAPRAGTPRINDRAGSVDP